MYKLQRQPSLRKIAFFLCQIVPWGEKSFLQRDLALGVQTKYRQRSFKHNKQIA